MRPLRPLSALAVTSCVTILAACGGSASKVGEQLAKHSISPKVSPVPAAVVSNAEIAATPVSSPQRAFLNMWSELQWQSWTEAIAHYQPGLVRAIGAARMLQALAFEASLYRTSKPVLHGQTRRHGLVTIRYTLAGAKALVVPSSITWQREAGHWVVYYDPSLDNILRSWAQAQQTSSAPGASASAQVLAAGVKATELQSRYLSRRLGRDGG